MVAFVGVEARRATTIRFVADPRRPNPIALPWTTLRLAGRYAVPLIAWYAFGQAARYGIIELGSSIVHGDHQQVRSALGLILLTVLALLTIAVPIAMLHSVRRGLATLRGDTTTFTTALARAMFPFVVIYFSWGFLVSDARVFERADLLKHISEMYKGPGSTAGQGLLQIGLPVALAIAVGCYFIRAYFEYLANRRDRRSFPLLAAYFEAAFNIFGLFSVFDLVSNASGWVGDRSVWVSASNAIDSLPGWGTFWTQAGDLWGVGKDAVILPLLWLTVAALVYGRQTSDEAEIAKGTRMSGLYRRLEEMSPFKRWLVDHVYTGRREQWAPIIGAARLALTAGTAAVGMLCFCYVGIDAATQLGWRGAVELIGPQNPPSRWGPMLVPLDFARDMVKTVLQMCLLAATFDLAVRHERARAAERGTAPSAERGDPLSARTTTPASTASAS